MVGAVSSMFFKDLYWDYQSYMVVRLSSETTRHVNDNMLFRMGSPKQTAQNSRRIYPNMVNKQQKGK